MTTNKMREEFEAWAKSQAIDLRMDENEWLRNRHYHSLVDAMWAAWQAATRRAMPEAAAVNVFDGNLATNPAMAALDRLYERGWTDKHKGRDYDPRGTNEWQTVLDMLKAAALPDGFVPVPAEDAKNAERYKWLRGQMVGAHFNFDDEGMCVLAFEMPESLAVCADCDANIDAAMLQAAPKGSEG